MASDRMREYVEVRLMEIEEQLIELETEPTSEVLRARRELLELQAELMKALETYTRESSNAN